MSAGNYSENINFSGKNILLEGEGVESTFIDGNQNGSVVTFNGGESLDAIIRGFTITNGNASYGGGFYIKDSDPTLDRLKIINNNGNEGGGVFIEDSEPILNNILISNNSSEIGGGFIAIARVIQP